MLSPTPDHLEYLMAEAIMEAKKAAAKGEVPVGAVISHAGRIVGRGHNTTEADGTVIAHAELHAMREASSALGGWRLTECILAVTLEPCTMCIGAIRLARIPVIAFGAGDSKQGALGSLYDLGADPRLGPQPRVISNLRGEECAHLLRTFFTTMRGA